MKRDPFAKYPYLKPYKEEPPWRLRALSVVTFVGAFFVLFWVIGNCDDRRGVGPPEGEFPYDVP